MSIRKRVNIIYPELSYRLTGILFKIHNELGRFCREKQYADLLDYELKKSGLKYKREKEIPLQAGDYIIGGNRVDFYIEDKILVDIKAKKFISKEDYYQIRRYLKATGLKLGLIVNFRDTFLKPKRVLNTEINLQM